MNKLVLIETLATEAEKRGFRVWRGHHGAEMWAPQHAGPTAVYSGDACYSTAEFVLSDRGGIGYGYNEAFNGPWHDGHCQSSDYGVRKLLAHPAMAGVSL